jgi:GT2 family glycosyltransferase
MEAWTVSVSAVAVSVVVPTRGRPALLRRCLAALCGQTLAASGAARHEVVVVDDGPDPRTRALVAACGAGSLAAGGPPLRYVANRGRHGPAAARNLGWRAARAPVIAFTDDDTVPAPDWLEQGMAVMAAGAGAVCGRVVMPVPAPPSDYERDAQRLETAEFITANCFCRKSVLARAGGFDERFRMAWREDSDLHFRLLDMGVRVLHAPQAVVVHPVRPAPWGVSLLQQKKVLFDALLRKKHPRRYREKIRPRPPWAYRATLLMLLAAAIAGAAGSAPAALAAGAGWLALTARFCRHRLSGTRHDASHVAEMIVTSALIPPCAEFWRAVGVLRFGLAARRKG